MTPSTQPIEIIGGGLAGLSLGLALRRHAVDVTLFEAGNYPRHRVCGEFIAGLTTPTITRLGLAPFLADALSHREVAWFLDDSGRPARLQALPSPALGISRRVLDARLAAAFAAAGGDLRTGTRSTDLAPRAGRVFATGRRRSPSPWLGLKLHVHGLTLAKDLELHLGEHAYVGLAKVESGAVNVCGLFRRRVPVARPAPKTESNVSRYSGPEVLLDYLATARLGWLAARLRAADLDHDSFCAIAGVGFNARVPASNRVSLGDACAMIPPFTGNGMAMAFQSAEIALDPLVAYAHGRTTWSAASGVINDTLRREFRLRLATADALHPFLLTPPRQRWLRTLNRARLLPLRPLYAALH
jgi:flavin-dependent dehydrogenase